MNVPMQSRPVQRVIATYSCDQSELHGAGPGAMSNNGIAPCEYGVEPSFWGGILDVVKKVAPMILSSI